MMEGRPEAKPWPRSLRSLWVLLAMMVTAVDYISKEHVVGWLVTKGGRVEVLPFLNLVSSRNTGIAFGFLADLGIDKSQLLVIMAFAICMGAYAFIMLYRQLDITMAFVAALVLGGGLGNALDRLVNGSVFDFIDVHAFGWHWPAFNVADMAISLAVIILFYQAFKGDGQDKEAKRSN